MMLLTVSYTKEKGKQHSLYRSLQRLQKQRKAVEFNDGKVVQNTKWRKMITKHEIDGKPFNEST